MGSCACGRIHCDHMRIKDARWLGCPLSTSQAQTLFGLIIQPGFTFHLRKEHVLSPKTGRRRGLVVRALDL